MWELAAVFLGSVLVAALVRRFVKPDAGDILIASLIFVPVVLFLITERNLTQLSGFGVVATFEATATQSLDEAFGQEIGEALPTSLTDAMPDPQSQPDARAATFESCQRHFVLHTDKVPDRSAPDFAAYVVNATQAIRSSIACGRLVGVIVLDGQRRYVGSYDAEFFRESLSLWTLPMEMSEKEVAARIEQRTIFGAALVYPDKRLTSGEGYVAAIGETATLLDAFAAFDEVEGRMLVVTDALGRMKGVLERRVVVDAVLRGVIETLTSDT